MIDTKVLTAVGVSQVNADKYIDDLNEVLPEYEINTPLRISHFLAQVVFESAYMKATVENLNYSADGLRRVFPKYFRSANPNAYARQPEKIANRVYANRMGNGDESSGDGWLYRGRGLIQLTGKNNYQAFSDWVEEDVVSDPDLVSDEYAVHSAVFYWDSNDLNDMADDNDCTGITKAINGGTNGLDERASLQRKIKRLIG